MTLIFADSNETCVIPIFILDPHQLDRTDKSNNCVQFMVESLIDLKQTLKENNSDLHICHGSPWVVVEQLIKDWKINSVYMNMDYSKYSQYRDNKILNVCKKNKVQLIVQEDIMLNNVETVKTSTGKHYEKFTPYYEKAHLIRVRQPQRHVFKHLSKKHIPDKLKFDNLKKLYINNDELYLHGGRTNGLKLLQNLHNHKHYNETKDSPVFDTTTLSPHNKFGTVSIREVYHKIKSTLGSRTDLLRQLYWRDFYYSIVYHNVEYIDMTIGKYANMKWKNNSTYFRAWKTGTTGIPIVDAGIIQLNRTGWIHNRVRMLLASMLTKVFHIDWRLGEKYFKKHLIDYDITQNVMNWYWISGEVPFANPYFRVLNPVIQNTKHDHDCKYSNKWKKTDCVIEPIVDVGNMIKLSVKQYK
jgi:deoxyribodipyrimidine photo-lyase